MKMKNEMSTQDPKPRNVLRPFLLWFSGRGFMPSAFPSGLRGIQIFPGKVGERIASVGFSQALAGHLRS